MTKFYTTFFLATLFLFACKSASKAYDKGNYREAISRSLKKLQKSPSDGEARAVLQAAYKDAVAVSESEIRSYSNSGAPNRYEAIYAEYRKLQSLYEEVRPYPSLVSLVRATDYSDYVRTYGEKAAERYYQDGIAEMEKGDKPGYRNAYRAFRSAARFSDNRDTRLKMEEAYEAAVVNIVVLPVNSRYSAYDYNRSYKLRNFEDELLRNIRYGINNEFIRIHSEWEARSKGIRPDQVLQLQLGRFDFGRPYDQNSRRTVSKDVVVKETVFRPDSVVKQYAKVSATIVTTKRTVVSTGEVFMAFLDTEGRIIWSDRLQGEHQWQTAFATYQGDERALSDSDKSELNKSAGDAPGEDEMVDGVLRQIESDMRYRLRTYFSRLD